MKNHFVSEINIYKTTEINKVLPKLVENIIAQGKKIYLYCDSPEQEKSLDHLLWSYSQLSFIPHGTISDPYPGDQVLLLGQDLDYNSAAEILICGGKVDNLDSIIDRYKKILLFSHESINAINDVQINIIEQDISGKWIKQKV
jgi:DNA polymerase-3 subunit chi